MSYNIEDPLADLLSDNSLDNDNFFDNPSGSASLTKNQTKPTKVKSKMDDLFGIQEETETDIKSPVRLDFSSKPMAMSTPRIVKQKPSISQDDDDDDDLGFDPKKPKGGSGAKRNLLDDFLGTVEKKFTPRKEEQSTKPPMSRQSTDTTTDTSNLLQSQARPKTSSGRRSSAQSAVVNTDPLGLFGREKEINATVSGMSTPVSKRRGPTADWLGLGSETAAAVEQEARPSSPLIQREVKLPTQVAAQDSVEIMRVHDTADNEELQAPRMETNTVPPEKSNLSGDSTAQNILLFNSLNMETNNAFAALKQQESQLMLAAQMKNQEHALLDMQRKQENLLQQQERQFHTLLQQQLQRQQQMEEHIRLQQQRINTHIHLLMSQPASAQPMQANITVNDTEVTQLHDDSTLMQKHSEKEERESPAMQLLEYETDVKRLELEKLRLEELVANMKVNHEQEIEMIESSYRKQMKVLKEQQAAVEERLKQENTELKQYYTQKLQTIEQDLQKLLHESEANVASLKQDHEDELRKLRKSHEDDLEMLKEEHRRMLETIRQSKMLEFAAVQDNGNYLDVLRSATNNLESLSGGLQGMRDEMQTKLEMLNKEREKKLEARERRLEDAERRLKLNEDTADEEKNRLMELVSTLELQLNRISKETAEENWQLRQRMASLEAEKQAFEREKEYQREQLAKDEKRIDDLKAQQLAETEHIMAELQQERHRIVVERTRVEMERELHMQTDLDKDRLEVEARLKVAHDSIRRADEEREKYHKMQRELEQRKRKLIDQENTMNAKEDDLAQEASAYRMAEGRARLAEQKSRQCEELLQAKLQLLTKRMRELSEREEYLSQERMLLAQDRIALHNLKLKLAQSKCTLCKMAAESAELTHLLRRNDIKQIISGVGVGVGVGNTQPRNSPDVSNALSFAHNAFAPQTDLVDRMLDENIAASYRRMHNAAAHPNVEYWSIAGLDDDSKKLALNNNIRDNADSDIELMSPNLI